MTNAEKLAAAQTAYHDLMTGAAVRVWQDQNGERVEYTAANSTRLKSYIEYLETLLGTPNPSKGPLRVTF